MTHTTTETTSTARATEAEGTALADQWTTDSVHRSAEGIVVYQRSGTGAYRIIQVDSQGSSELARGATTYA